jgi:hypothetical protein
MKKKEKKKGRVKKKATAKKIVKKTKKKAVKKPKIVPTKKKAKKVKKIVKKVKEKKPVKKAVKKKPKKVKAKIKKPVKRVVKKKIKKVKVEKKPKKIVKKVVAKPKKKILPKTIQPPMPWEALPAEYGEDSITLMTVDPRKVFAYWEVREDALASYPGILNIRVYDVTGIDFDGTNANSYFDIAVNEAIGSWYIDVSPAKEFIADIGVISPKGVFIIIARSNKVSTPRAEIVGEEIEKGMLTRELYKTDLPIGY